VVDPLTFAIAISLDRASGKPFVRLLPLDPLDRLARLRWFRRFRQSVLCWIGEGGIPDTCLALPRTIFSCDIILAIPPIGECPAELDDRLVDIEKLRRASAKGSAVLVQTGNLAIDALTVDQLIEPLLGLDPARPT